MIIKSILVHWTDGTSNTFLCSDVILQGESYFLHNLDKEATVVIPSTVVKYITVQRG